MHALLQRLGVLVAPPAAPPGAHTSAVDAWRVVGPLSMSRQVLGAATRQLAALEGTQHELRVASERWQTEADVRIRRAAAARQLEGPTSQGPLSSPPP